VFVAAGDGGAAGCDTFFAAPPASQVASANYICASGNVTCVGGTEFADTASPATYWNASNTSALASAKSYIPEGAWNEPLDSSNKPVISAGGGGVSVFIAKPSWQKGTSVPADGYRDTPDIAFTSSGHDGYFGCYSADAFGNCATGSFEYFIGTSAATPSMAGIASLATQHAGKPLGNLNPLLYSIANGAAPGKVFHDVTVATSGVASCTSQPSMCNSSTPGQSGLTGGLAGYQVGAGFDLATGWGSLDVANFLDAVGSGGSSGSDGGTGSSGSDSGASSSGSDSGASSSGSGDAGASGSGSDSGNSDGSGSTSSSSGSGSGTSSSGSDASSGSTSSGSGSGTSSSGSASGSGSSSGISSGSTSSGGSTSSSTGSSGSSGSSTGSSGTGSTGSGAGVSPSPTQDSSGCSCDAVGARSNAQPTWAGIGLLIGWRAVSRRRGQRGRSLRG
jgi:hypothetical protein